MKWAGHVARMWERGCAHMVLAVNPEGRRSIGRPRRRWEDNIKMDGMGGGAWTGLMWLRTGIVCGYLQTR